MRVAVLGGGGFIGSALTKSLLEDGHEVRVVDIKPVNEWWQVSDEAENISMDLRITQNADSSVKDCQYVYDLAEDMGGVGWLESNRSDGLASFRIVLNVAEACHKAGVQRLYFASSACAYNTDLQLSPDIQSLKESDISPAKPEKGYGEAKWMGERLLEYYDMEGKLETRVARYHNIYGPHGTYVGGREKSPAAMCYKTAKAVVTGSNEIEIWGDGNQTRSFCFIDDCVRGTKEIMNGENKQPVNLGSTEMVTINKLLDTVEEIAGTKLNRTYDLSAPQGVRGRSSDNTLFHSLYGWEPSTSLRQGLEKTYEWIFNEVKNG